MDHSLVRSMWFKKYTIAARTELAERLPEAKRVPGMLFDVLLVYVLLLCAMNRYLYDEHTVQKLFRYISYGVDHSLVYGSSYTSSIRLTAVRTEFLSIRWWTLLLVCAFSCNAPYAVYCGIERCSNRSTYMPPAPPKHS